MLSQNHEIYLRKLFSNTDAVLQRAGFYLTHEQIAETRPDCFVSKNKDHYESMVLLNEFMDKLKLDDIKDDRLKILKHLEITNDGSPIFDIPQLRLVS